MILCGKEAKSTDVYFSKIHISCTQLLLNSSWTFESIDLTCTVSSRWLRVRLADRRPAAHLVRVRGRGALRLAVVAQLPAGLPQAQQGHQVGEGSGSFC